ncbi:MAG TPA: type IV pilus twitching motility protein PilT [Gemmatimonadales bacterium]|nr:type IV pilus twitching motility protein PilT [Gemmatimonadales bacterium]
MHEHRAEGLQLTPGKPVSLLSRGAARPVTREALTDAQVLGLLREIAPVGMAGLVPPVAPLSFPYDAPSGATAVEVEPGTEGLNVVLRPSGDGSDNHRPAAAHAQAAAAPAPAPAEDPAAKAEMEALFRVLISSGASDLHLRADEPPILRLHGELVRHEAAPLSGERIEQLLISIMPQRDREQFRDTGDADYAYELDGEARFRCNAARDRRGAMGVFRIIPAKILTADELGLSTEVQALCQLNKGLVVVTGPTGSGKSTTLAAMIDLVNRTRTDHVLTIEDPIEFVHPSKRCIVTQRQVGLHTQGFKQALRAALREDPDVVLVGEMRDLETVAIAIETAETGHLVFGTLHTTTAASTVDRIIDQFPTDRQSQVRVMLSESLRGVISQTLCKKIGGGRVAAQEILLTIPAVSNLIREGKTFQIPSIMQTNRKVGMVTLNDALLDLVERKLVEPQEAYLKAVDKTGLLTSLKARRHDTSFVGEA